MDGSTRYRFTLTGVTPLLLHADDIAWADQMSAWAKTRKRGDADNRAGDDRCPPYRYLGSFYSDGARLIMPQENLAKCLLLAAKTMPKGKGSLKTESVIDIVLEQQQMPLLVGGKECPWAPIAALQTNCETFDQHREAIQKMDIRLSMKRVTIGQGKHIRVRPIIDRWSVVGTMMVFGSTFKLDTLQELFTTAGHSKGLGDWRPSSPKVPGGYGRFTAEVARV